MSFKERLDNLSRHLMTGVSYMIPVVVAGGLMVSIAIMIGGTGVWEAKEGFAATIKDIGLYGLGLIVPVIAAYIAYSIADKPGIAPGFIVGMLAKDMGTGFLGGIIVGLMVGYFVELLKKIQAPAAIMPVISILLIPVASTFVVGVTLKYIIGGPIIAATKGITAWLGGMQAGNQIILAAILGAMMAFDMGGPVNKTALTFAYGLYAEKIYGPATAIHIAIAIPPLGLALAAFLASKRYSNEEKEAAKSALVMGIVGITEGAIPFALADPVRVIPAIMIGSAVSSGLSAALGVVNPVLMATVFATPFVNKPLLHVVAVLAGVVTTAVLVNVFKSIGAKKNNSETEVVA
ncbi:PTS fructose transporter subunit IIC [Fonticella tunisiensis]|uniref:Fructose-specific PTS system IIC-like component n=1 Tax=Fonticella tunisiensis TaxID=1096341 RepID=A0A4R7KSK7_9CLOT|nr:PTS fructose transporter subunit IIC [Fonticella tunisiensis]TDT62748.1 fructose-specific PTS system IIC-like component [Fonticella tunisiensis]